jgi:uncharacterized protein (DUF302 family)
MLESAQSSDWVITKLSSKSVAETVDRLKRFIEVRGFTLFRVIDHSGQAERVGLQMPEMKLVMFGKPTAGAAVMLAAPLAGLDLPLKILVWEDGNGAVSVSYNSPGFMAERLHIEGALRAHFDAVESIVEEVVGP